MGDKWCGVCGTRHDLGPRCPGEVQPSGPERMAWRVLAEQGMRQEEYGVLVAPCENHFRARILTLPNMLWSIPGGRGTVKFLGQSQAEAERRARDFIREFCAKRGLTLKPSNQVSRGNSDGDRKPHAIPVKFGEEKPDRKGSTTDLSVGGMFVATTRPLPAGRKLRLLLEVGAATLPLQATVAWARATSGEEGPAGMGLQVHGAPALYRHYVREITGAQLPDDEQVPEAAGAAAAGTK